MVYLFGIYHKIFMHWALVQLLRRSKTIVMHVDDAAFDSVRSQRTGIAALVALPRSAVNIAAALASGSVRTSLAIDKPELDRTSEGRQGLG